MSTTTGPDDVLPDRFCTQCGDAGNGARFCGKCGTPLLRPVPAQRVADPAIAAAAPAIEDGTMAPAAQEEPEPTEVLVRSELDDLLGGSAAGMELNRDERVAGTGSGTESEQASRPRRRVAVAAAVAVSVALIASGAYVALLRPDPVRDALAAGQAQYIDVMQAVTRASDAAAVSSAARRAAAVDEVVEEQAEKIEATEGAFAGAAEAQLRAEVRVLRAVATLAQLGEGAIAAWGTGHQELTAAFSGERTSRSALERHDPDLVAGLPDVGPVRAGLAAAVAPELSGDATEQSFLLLAELEQATTTGALREIAGRAAAQAAGVRAAEQSLADGLAKTTLTGLSSALSALGGLGELSGENPGAWDSARTAVAAGFTQVADGSGEVGAEVRAALPEAIAAVDRMVAGAAAAIADWQAKHAAAVQARTDEIAALKGYADSFRATTTRYEQLRQDLSAFIDRVEDPTVWVTYWDVYDVMITAASERVDVRDSLNWFAVPSEMKGAHGDVVAVIDRSIRAVQSASDGLDQAWFCDTCTYDETPGWRAFQSESEQISAQYADALAAWESAVSGAEATISNRELPAKPEV